MNAHKPLSFAAALVAVTVSGAALASELVYAPRNPSFGGNPFYSEHLIGTANAQNKHLSPAEKTARAQNELALREQEFGLTQSQQAIKLNELATRQSELGIRESELGLTQSQQAIRLNELATQQSERDLLLSEQSRIQNEQAIRLNRQSIEANERAAMTESPTGRTQAALDDVLLGEIQSQISTRVFGPGSPDRGTFQINGLTANYRRGQTTTAVTISNGSQQIRSYNFPNPQF
jgi:hypothetical protein